MILDDAPRFEAVMQRMARLEFRRELTKDELRDWFSQLQRYPIDIVVRAVGDAPGERAADPKTWWMITASLVEGLCSRYASAVVQENPTRYVPKGEAVIHAPGTRLHGKRMQVVEAKHRCALCEDRLFVRTTPTPRPGIEPEVLAQYSYVTPCPQCRPQQAQQGVA